MEQNNTSYLFSIFVIFTCFLSGLIGLLPTLIILILIWLIIVIFHQLHPDISNIKIGAIISFTVFAITTNALITTIPLLGLLLDIIKMSLVVYIEQNYFTVVDVNRLVLFTNIFLLVPFKYSFMLEIQGCLIVLFNYLEPESIKYYTENDELKMLYHRHAWMLSVGYSYVYILAILVYFIHYIYNLKYAEPELNVEEKTIVDPPKRIAVFQKVISSDDVYNIS